MRANSKPVHRARHRAAHRVSRVATSPPNQTNLAACFRCRSRSRRLITPHGGVHTWKACGRLFFCLYYSQHVNLLLIPLRDFWYATHFHRNPSVDAHTRPERVAHVRIVRTQFFPLSTHGEQSSCDTMSAPQAPVKLRNGVVKQVRNPSARTPADLAIDSGVFTRTSLPIPTGSHYIYIMSMLISCLLAQLATSGLRNIWSHSALSSL